MSPDLDLYWLNEALNLARRCPPSTSAFSVGAIVVDSNDVEISRGFSRELDASVHAEESALAKVTDLDRLHGATLYSTLEPCNERRSRPTPCARLIIQAGIQRVVFAWREPSTYVAVPSGVRFLLEAGVEVIERPDLGPPNL